MEGHALCKMYYEMSSLVTVACGVSRIATKMRPSSVSGFSSRHKLRNPDRRSWVFD